MTFPRLISGIQSSTEPGTTSPTVSTHQPVYRIGAEPRPASPMLSPHAKDESDKLWRDLLTAGADTAKICISRHPTAMSVDHGATSTYAPRSKN